MIHNNSYLRVYYNRSDALATPPYWTYHMFPKDWSWVNEDFSDKHEYKSVENFCGPTHSVKEMRYYLQKHFTTLKLGRVVSSFLVE